MGKKKREYDLPKELEQPEKYRHGLKYWLISDDKMEEALETRFFIQPQGFAEHLDFFLRYCASCEHSVIDIDIYTEDKKIEVDGKTILHKKGEIIMDVENINAPVYDWSYKREGCRKDAHTFIYKNPNYQWLGGEYTRDRLRFTFYEPDCWILKIPRGDLCEIVKEYGGDSYVWHHFLYGNPGNIRIGCGEIGFDARRRKLNEFWRYLYHKRSRPGRPAR